MRLALKHRTVQPLVQPLKCLLSKKKPDSLSWVPGIFFIYGVRVGLPTIFIIGGNCAGSHPTIKKIKLKQHIQPCSEIQNY